MVPGLKRKEERPMERVRLLPQGKILQEWWQEVKENFWEERMPNWALTFEARMLEYFNVIRGSCINRG